MPIFRSATLIIALLLSALFSMQNAAAAPSALDGILESGLLRVGTTGDFKPFTYLNPDTDEYEGIDIEAARSIAAKLGVELEFVKTTWPTLLEGIQNGQYDLAVGGITRTLERQKFVSITDPYFQVGKCPLVRIEDKDRLSSIEAINTPSVRIGVNPGGTNERFVRQYLSNADITVVPDNLSIPGRVQAGEFDVMITDNAEALLFAAQLEGLAAARANDPFTHDDFGYLIPRDDVAWLAWLNLWIHQAQANGDYRKWESAYFPMQAD